MSELYVNNISPKDDCFSVRHLRTFRIMEKEDFMKQFRAALSMWVKREGYGSQNRLAAAVGVSPQYLSEILNEKKDGTEEKRRAIAEASGHTYEEFLNIGREILESGQQQDKNDTNKDAEFGRRVTEIREHFKFTQQQMAEHLGISLKTYQRMESGEGDKVSRRALEVYVGNNISLNWLFSGKGPMFLDVRTKEKDLIGIVLSGSGREALENRVKEVEEEWAAMRSLLQRELREFKSKLLRVMESLPPPDDKDE